MNSLSVREDLDLQFVSNMSMNKYMHNITTTEEVVGDFRSVNGEPLDHKHDVAHYKQKGPKFLSVLSPHCDLMVYFLLFPSGVSGRRDPKMTYNGS